MELLMRSLTVILVVLIAKSCSVKTDEDFKFPDALIPIDEKCDLNKFQSHQNDNFGFRIEYPTCWVVPEDQKGRIFYAHEVHNSKLDVRTNVDIYITDSSETMSLNNFVDSMILDWQNGNDIYSSVNILSKESSQVQGYDCIKILAEGNSTSYGKEFEIKWKKSVFKRDEYIYELTSTSSKIKFDTSQVLINRIFDSFELFDL